MNGFQFSSAFLAQTGQPVTIHGSRTSVCRTYIGSVGQQTQERTESFNYDLINRNVFNTTGPTTVTITPGYALPSDPDFQQPSAVFKGGNSFADLGIETSVLRENKTRNRRCALPERGQSRVFDFHIYY